MLWNYDDSWREKFETCEHRDILIVPHGTNVIKNPGGAPTITSKIPKLDPETDTPIPGEFRQVEFIITNDDIYKEKFEYTNSLDTNEDLAFCGCESAMVKFTIRNNKTYNEETGKWVPDIPNLQNYVITDENGTTIVGEVDTHYIIKLYMYFNGDSSSLIYLGMFIVEEDKVSSDGYTRDITAFDFLYQIRDMDIHNWYKHLFRGVKYNDNDFKDYFTNRNIKVPEDYKEEPIFKEDGFVKGPQERWTIGDMLKHLFKFLLRRYPGQKTVTNREKSTEDNTADHSKKEKQIDTYPVNDNEPYTGLAMPIVLDPDLFDSTKTYNIPESPSSNARECYGYMDIMNLPVYEDPKIMDAEALSAGKFLEDIGALAGRYPYIRLDYIEDDDYHALHAYDPNDPDPDSSYYPYNLYEKCVLTFKPLPKDDTKIASSNYFDNNDIAKGFKHDQYAVGTVHIWELVTRFDDDPSEPTISYANLTKEQNKMKELSPSSLKKMQTNNNMFIDYLAKKEDDIKLAKKPPEPAPTKAHLKEIYAKLINLLMYGEEVLEPVTKNQKNGLLHQGYATIKYRTYTPFELTTFADPVREVGDRIQIHFEDKVTGEIFDFPTYILSRKISGIQKMMDTYVAKGATANVTFSNYKTGTTYAAQTLGYYGNNGSNSTSGNAGGTIFTGLTKDDFAEIIRNIGFRLLNEPTSVVARFVAATTSESNDNPQLYELNYPKEDPTESEIHDGDTTNPIIVYDFGSEELKTYDIKIGDYVHYADRAGDGYEYPSSEHISPYYVWDGSKWVYVDYCNAYDHAYYGEEDGRIYGMIVDEYNNGDIVEGSTNNNLTLRLYTEENATFYYHGQIENTKYHEYNGSCYDLEASSSLSVTAGYGDLIANGSDPSESLKYQYPGVWVKANTYPSMDPITVNVKPHVELKWSDPVNITTWEPKPCAWEGTVIIRKRNSAPLHRWDGELIVDSTTRDAYKDTAFIDDTIQLNKTYYYGFFPYYTAYTEDGHAIKYYRFTKTIRVSTGTTIDAPEIISIERIS